MDHPHVCHKEGEIAKLSERINGALRRIDEQREIATGITKLATSVEVMATEMTTVKGDLKEVKSDVEELKAKPGKRWDLIIGTIATGLVSAGLGFILSKIL